MKKIFTELKNILPFDYNYFNYLRTISPSVDNNINFNAFIKIIIAFVCSIFFSNFILSYSNLTIKLNESINFYYLLKIYILNTLSYSFILSILVFFFLKKMIYFFSYFIQGIKMYTIFNLTISLLFVFLINIKINSYLNLDSTSFFLFSILLLFMQGYILYKFLYKELVVSLSIIKHSRKIALFIFFCVPYFNNFIYQNLSYNHVDINKLFSKKIVCDQLIDVKYDRLNDDPILIQKKLNECHVFFSHY